MRTARPARRARLRGVPAVRRARPAVAPSLRVVPRVPDNLRVLGRRDFRLLFLGQGVSVLGDRMVAVALAFAVLEVGGSPSEVGLVLACKVFPLVGSVLIGGVVGDRTSRRSVMIAADLV